MGAIEQSTTPSYNSGSAATIAQAYGSDVTAGNVLLAIAHYYNDTVTVSSVAATAARNVTDWTEMGSLLVAAQSPDARLAVYVGTVGASGACTVTFTLSGATTDRTIHLYEISGVTITDALTNGATGNSTTANSGNITLNDPGMVVKVMNDWPWVGNYDEAQGTPSTGWTDAGENATGYASAYQNFSTGPGSINGTYTKDAAGGPDEWCCRVVALLDAAGGPVYGLAPDPVTLPLILPDPAVGLGALGLAPDPVTLPLVLPDPALDLGQTALTPDPTTLPLILPDPAVGLGALGLTPDPTAMPLVLPAPALDFGQTALTPDPTAMPLVLPAPVVALGALGLTPDPATLQVSLPAPTIGLGVLNLAPDPTTMPLVVPAGTIALGDYALAPDPTVLQLLFPSPTIAGAAVLQRRPLIEVTKIDIIDEERQ